MTVSVSILCPAVCISTFMNKAGMCCVSTFMNKAGMCCVSTFMAFAPSLALDPTFGIHSHKTLYRHCLALSSFKAKLKTFLFSQHFHPNLSTQFLLQLVCVCVCARVCVCVVRFLIIIFYNTLCKLFW